MIPEGADPRVARPWFWTGMLYLAFVGWFILSLPLMVGILFLVEGSPGIAMAMFGICGALVLAYMAWLAWFVRALAASFRYRLDDEYLIIERGVWNRRKSRIPLHRVQDVVVRQGPLLRRVGLATVHVQTAGMHAAAGNPQAEGIMPGLPDGDAVAQEILSHVQRLRRRS